MSRIDATTIEHCGTSLEDAPFVANLKDKDGADVAQMGNGGMAQSGQTREPTGSFTISIPGPEEYQATYRGYGLSGRYVDIPRFRLESWEDDRQGRIRLRLDVLPVANQINVFGSKQPELPVLRRALRLVLAQIAWDTAQHGGDYPYEGYPNDNPMTDFVERAIQHADDLRCEYNWSRLETKAFGIGCLQAFPLHLGGVRTGSTLLKVKDHYCCEWNEDGTLEGVTYDVPEDADYSNEAVREVAKLRKLESVMEPWIDHDDTQITLQLDDPRLEESSGADDLRLSEDGVWDRAFRRARAFKEERTSNFGGLDSEMPNLSKTAAAANPKLVLSSFSPTDSGFKFFISYQGKEFGDVDVYQIRTFLPINGESYQRTWSRDQWPEMFENLHDEVQDKLKEWSDRLDHSLQNLDLLENPCPS